jgi:S1-C subfamily serine protease
MTVRAIDDKTKKEYKVDGGVLVTDIKRFGAAANGNLLPNDVIYAVKKKNGEQPVNSTSDLETIIKERKPGDTVLLKVKTKDQDGKPGNRFVAIEIPRE